MDQIVSTAEPSGNEFFEPTNAINKTPKVSFANIKTFRKPYAGTCLRDPENSPHDESEDRNAEPLIRKDSIDLVANISFFGKYLTCFNLFYDSVYKLEALTVSSFDNGFVGKVDVTLMIRCFLCLTCQGCGSGDKCLESFC